MNCAALSTINIKSQDSIIHRKFTSNFQIGGLRFLYDNIIESTSRYDQSNGFGCILAHSMGLGKTLQLVAFSDIFLRHTSGTFL